MYCSSCLLRENTSLQEFLTLGLADPALWSHFLLCEVMPWEMGARREGRAEEQWLWICKIHIINKLSIIHTCSSISHLCRHLFSCSTDKSPPEALCCFWPVGSSSCELRQSHQQLLNCFLQWTWAKALWDKIRRILAILMSFFCPVLLLGSNLHIQKEILDKNSVRIIGGFSA